MVDKYKKKIFKFEGRTLTVQGYEPQAARYMVAQGINADGIFFECENKVPRIRYKYGGRYRDYVPDMYVVDRRLIVEVKSEQTLGLRNNTHRGFSMNCAKAKACKEAGFKFCLLLMTADGQRLILPKQWYKMKKEALNAAIDELNPNRGKPKIAMLGSPWGM